MNFGQALAAMRRGQRVTRDGWDNPARWLLIVPGSTITVDAARPLGQAAPNLIGEQVQYAAHIDQFQGDVLAPWAATSADLLAEDWRGIV